MGSADRMGGDQSGRVDSDSELKIQLTQHIRLAGRNDVAPIIIGTARFATLDDRDQNTGYFLPAPERVDNDVELLRREISSALDSVGGGYIGIDTARAYGLSEHVIGEVMRRRGNYRRHVVICTKVGNKSHDPQSIKQEIEVSYRELRTEIDILFVHDRLRDGETKEQMTAYLAELARAVNDGKASGIGISNFQAHELEMAINIMAEIGLPIAAYQAKINLAHPRKDMAETMAICQRHGIPFMASSALDRGGIIRTSDSVINEIAKRNGMTPAQVAIFAVANLRMLPVVQSHSSEHMNENFAALRFGVNQSDAEMLKDILMERVRRAN